MTNFELVVTLPGATAARIRVPERGLLIGRNEDCDISMPHDASVSRQHARVYPKGDLLIVEDLGSRNGIYRGKERHLICQLTAGQDFQVGEQIIRVGRSDDSSIKHSVIRPETVTDIEDEILGDSANRSLRLLFQAARLLGETFDARELSHDILKLIFDAVPARRGYILTLKGDPPEPSVEASMSRSSHDGGPPLSHTLIDHVFTTREAVLIHDAQHDSRFDESASIIGHEIHSAMCAPLMGRREPVGVLYLDSGTNIKPFERRDLQLLTAIARIVGVALENAQLHEERMQHERLAAIGEATAGLGHCIKNIMTGLRGSADMIDAAMQNRDMRKMETAWPILTKCVTRIDTLVMNMLSYSRHQALEPMLTDLNSLIAESIEVLRSQAEFRHVALHFVPTDNGLIEADGREMHRVFVNLLSNAIESCGSTGGEVHASIQREQDGLTVQVRDNGAGIPDDVLPRIFDAFFTTKGSRGTGLGLACCEKIIASHGGRIDVETRRDKGSTFIIYLPFERKDGKATQRMTLYGEPK